VTITDFLTITAACLRENPNTVLLIMTLLPAYKIQNKLRKIMDSKYKSETAKKGSVFIIVYNNKFALLATY
jgi:hypothetical protein